jgi:hypothetical protein
MDIARSVIIHEAQIALGPTLNEKGYFLDDIPPGGAGDIPESIWDFWFVKRPVPPDEVYHTISIVPTGASEDDLFNMNVHLHRSTYLLSAGPSPGKKRLFFGPLGMYFLDRIQRPHPWHFVTIEELRAEYADILDRLLRYGIPLLENPNCGWDEWLGNKPIRHGDGYIIFDPSGRPKHE